MAFVTLLSITQSLEQIMDPRDQSFVVDETQQPMMTSLHEKATLLLSFLENDSLKYGDSNLETRIRDTAYKAEAMIESGILNKNRSQTEIRHQESCLEFGHHDLEETVEQFNSLWEEVAKMEEMHNVDDLQPPTKSLPSASSQSGSTDRTDVIVHKEMMMEIKYRLIQSPSPREIISILGMPGIGKTTLTKTLYHDPRILRHFDVRAWTTVSQVHHQQQMLKDLLDCIEKINQGSGIKYIGRDLGDILYKLLKGRRYLIVIDDMWDGDAWNQVKRFLPEDNNGSRVILTTRLKDVADYIDCRPESIYRPHLLSPDESWKLLCQKVFNGELCPPILEEVGKEIAKNCKGLPLSLAVIGGILYEAERTLDYWSNIAQNVNSALNKAPGEVMNILSLSYKHLPHYLRACFLYMGVFPEDHEISKSKLIKFWIAEGFIKPIPSKCLEEVANEYLKNLVDRSMIYVHDQSDYDGISKHYGIHDLMRDLCMRIAQQEKFIKVVNSDLEISRDCTYNFRHIYIRPEREGGNIYTTLVGIYGMLPSFVEHSPIESSNTNLLLRVSNFHVPRVLHLDSNQSSYLGGFVDEIVLPANLRYFKYDCTGDSIINVLPSWISNLWNLQTLVITNTAGCSTISLPLEIWMMPGIRHIETRSCLLPNPFDTENGGKFVPLENLQTLTGVEDFRFSEEALRMMPNLKELGIAFFPDWSTDFMPSSIIGNLVLLHKLKVLNVSIWDEQCSLPENFLFAPTLEELKLDGFRLSPKDMARIGSLQYLQKLYLSMIEFDKSVWEPSEGEFLQLQSLTICKTNLMYLKADETNFPILEHLFFKDCNKLKEIPSGIAYIHTLRLIHVCEDTRTSSLKDSVEFIRDEQQGLENDRLQIVYTSYEEVIARENCSMILSLPTPSSDDDDDDTTAYKP